MSGFNKLFKNVFGVLLVSFGLVAAALGSALYILPAPRQPVVLYHFDLVKRLKSHVRTLATGIGERNWHRHAQLSAARDFVAEELKSYGYQVYFEEYQVQGKLCQNVVAVSPGKDPKLSKEIIVVGAHYDSAPNTPGADDNASGVSVLLETARALREHAGRRTLRFVAFSTEEAYIFERLPMARRLSTMGSHHHAMESRKRGDRIVGMVSLEMLGYYTDAAGSQNLPRFLKRIYPSRANFALLVGDVSSARLVWRLGRDIRAGSSLPMQSACLPRFVEGVENSDHTNFWAAGYPAVMLTDTAFYRNGHYHRPTDTDTTLDYGKMSLLVPGIVQALKSWVQ
jgi:hypothetical protein